MSPTPTPPARRELARRPAAAIPSDTMLPRLVLLAVAISIATGARAEPLPPRAQALMVLRVLAFDRGLERRASGAVLVAVAAKAGDAAGEVRRDQVVAALRDLSKDTRARGLAVEARAVTWDGSAQPLTRAAAVVVVGKLAEESAGVGQVTRARQVLSIGEEAVAVERGLSVAVFAREAKPVIAASMLSARQEGVSFEPSFLRQAELLEFGQ